MRHYQSAGLLESLARSRCREAAGTYSTSAYYCNSYYCNSYCCYLGAGNTAWGQASGFQKYGLPTGVSLRVFDRGCGNYCGGT